MRRAGRRAALFAPQQGRALFSSSRWRHGGSPARWITINVVAREALLAALRIEEAERLCVQGELRSFNNRREEGPKLVITVFARALSLAGGGEDVNAITLRGALCKPPVLRVTPMGRDICDLMLAVNRRCGRSDYLPCICWGARARAAALYGVGDARGAHGPGAEPAVHKAHRGRAGGKDGLRGLCVGDPASPPPRAAPWARSERQFSALARMSRLTGV